MKLARPRTIKSFFRPTRRAVVLVTDPVDTMIFDFSGDDRTHIVGSVSALNRLFAVAPSLG